MAWGVTRGTRGGAGGVAGCKLTCTCGKGCLLIGVNFRKNFLFRSVSLPVPSILTIYWSCSLHSITTPVLSQRLGLFPTWFCTNTFVPTVSGGSRFVCSDHASCCATCLFAMAASLWSSNSRQMMCGLYLPGSTGKPSLTCLPKTAIAGENLVVGSTVFL